VSVGSRPTLGGKDVVVEVHIADFAENLYGETIRVGFRSRLRDQRKFADLDQLARQIASDLDEALGALSAPPHSYASVRQAKLGTFTDLKVVRL